MTETLTPQAGDSLVVMYHYVRDPERTPFPSLKALRIGDFSAQLDWLAQAWRPVHYPQFEAARSNGSLPPSTTGLWTISRRPFRCCASAWSGVFFVAGATLDDPPRLLNVHKTHFLITTLGAERFSEDVLASVAVSGDAGSLGWRSEVYRYDDAPDLSAKHLLNYELSQEEADRRSCPRCSSATSVTSAPLPGRSISPVT